MLQTIGVPSQMQIRRSDKKITIHRFESQSWNQYEMNTAISVIFIYVYSLCSVDLFKKKPLLLKSLCVECYANNFLLQLIQKCSVSHDKLIK